MPLYQQRDPYEDLQRRQQRRLSRLNPGARQQQISQKEPKFELTDEKRQSLMKDIGGKTIGALYQFANLLDLPVSSVRDVASTVTGKPRNPFDQWLTPTTDDNRITARDLGRQWGWMGKKDTWGNLAGSIGMDVVMDPLTYVTMGASAGTSALSPTGKIFQKAGLLEHIPAFMQAERVAAEKFGADAAMSLGEAAVRGQIPKQMGKREAMRRITNPEQLLKNITDDEMRELARGRFNEVLKKATGLDSWDEYVAKYGEEGLTGSFRFGLPNWRIFGADPLTLKESPHVLAFSKNTPGTIGRAAKADAFFDTLTDNPLMRAGKQLLSAPAQSMGQKASQLAAKVGFINARIGKSYVKETINDTFLEMDNIKNGVASWDNYRGLNKDNILERHNELRSLLENFNAADPASQAVAQKIWGHMDSYLKRAKDRAVKIDPLDDEFIHKFFPRQLSAALKKNDLSMLEDMIAKPYAGSATSVYNIHAAGRMKLLKNINGGTAQINDLVTDPEWDTLIENFPKTEAIKKISQAIEKRYGHVISPDYQGQRLRKVDFGKMKNESEQYLKKLEQDALDLQESDTFQAIVNDTTLSAADKTLKAKEMFKKIGIMTDAGWEGPLVHPKDALYERKVSRYDDMAEMIYSMSPEGRKYGLFGNNPIVEAQDYFERMEDTLHRADVGMNILSYPSALRRAGTSQASGRRLGDVLEELGYDVEPALDLLAKKRNITDPQELKSLADQHLDLKVNKDLQNWNTMFRAPEATKFFTGIMDSFMSAFKANVTAPFPGFHVRNAMSGQLRNAVAGSFSMQSFKDSIYMMMGWDIAGADKLPFVIDRWNKITSASTDPVMKATVLDNKQANKILRMLVSDHDVIGPYGSRGMRVTDVRNIGEHTVTPTAATHANAGTAEEITATFPGDTPFSPKHMGKSYIGQTPETQFGVPDVFPMPWWDLPFFGMRKAAAKLGGAKKGAAIPHPRAGKKWFDLQKYADEPFWKMPREYKVPGAYENFGFKENAKLLDEAGGDVKWWGPVASGREAGHFVEGMNRIAPFMKKMRDGVDPFTAAKEVAEQQIEYGGKAYTAFERQVAKRIIPFYSFTSRSLPWAVRRFWEKPNNMLSQIVRGTKAAGEQQQRKYQESGPLPPYIRDTLAIPLPSPEGDGTKRFLTGVDVMSQDMWQLLMPLVSRDLKEFGYEVAGRSRPGLKKLIEQITGTSLWQRGVEGGRPLKQMDPAGGRFLLNLYTTMLGKENMPDGFEKQMLGKTSAVEHVLDASALKRYISTASGLLDSRKGLLAKATNALTGAKVTDVSPQKQEAILREYIRAMITDTGGKSFEKATYSREDLAAMTPAAREEAYAIKALMDERAKIAKKMKEKSRLDAMRELGIAP